MKLIIQIPCYNEAKTLSIALSALPRTVPGFDTVEWLIIDDGSQDDTVEVARENGVDHVVRHTRNQGLARGFMTGLDACLRLGADVIVNTDADNQYNADDIPALIAPILEHRADIVVGARPIDTIEHFSPVKKMLQKLGSWVVRVASNTDIPDAPSGFRAMSRAAAQRLMVFNDYTYTLETIIQAGQKNMAITSVPIRVNEDLRPSRLVKSIPSYIKRSIVTIIRIFHHLPAVPVFRNDWRGTVWRGLPDRVAVSWLLIWAERARDIPVPDSGLGALLVMGFQTLLVAFLADLLAANRKLMEDVRYNLKTFTHSSESIDMGSRENG